MLTEKPATTGLNDFRAVLEDLCRSPEEVDPRARREAAILAFGRRTSAQPRVSLLMQDAGALLTEVLEADLNGVAETAGPHTLTLTVSAGEEYGKPARPMVHKGPFDPAASMAAYAMNMAEPVISDDLAHERRFTDLFLRRMDAVSGLCVPLHASDRVFGALGVYQKHPRQFSSEDARFTEIICHLLSASLARASIEEERRIERHTAQTVLDTVESYVVHLDAEGRLLEVNRAFRDMTGLDIADLGDRPFWNVAIVPDEAGLVQQIIRSSVSQSQPCEFECRILAPESLPRPTTWSLSVLCDTAGKARSVVLAGVDRTEQFRLEEDLRKARSCAEKATQALQQLRLQIGEAASGLDDELSEHAGMDEAAGRPHEAGPPSPPPGPAGKNLRSSPRRSFHYRQKIAPIPEEGLPSRRDFVEVECRDISNGGIAFYLNRPPDFSNLIVALGVTPFESFFAARVARVTQSDDDGLKRYLVGCRFTGRVHM